jgi:copper chaperone CopZ
MKNILLVLTLAFSVTTKAQVTKVYLQASGLTCSMCSNSIHKALNTLDFIQTIDADIKTYTFEISFKPGKHADFDMIRKKVEDAGFSVSSFVAGIYFNNVPVKNNQPVTVDNYTLLFVNPEERSLNGPLKVRILDKGFVSSKEYKRNAFSTSLTHNGIYHVTL